MGAHFAEPWDRPGAGRRDAEPHRGEQLRLLSRSATALSYAAVLGLPGVLALALCVPTWWMALRDLARIRRRRMDRSGLRPTAEALRRVRAAYYRVFNIWIALTALVAFAWLAIRLYLGKW